MRYCFSTETLIDDKYIDVVEKYSTKIYDNEYCVNDQDSFAIVRRTVRDIFPVPEWTTISDNDGPFYYPYIDHVDLTLPIFSTSNNRQYFLTNSDQMIMIVLFALLPPSMRDDTVLTTNLWLSFIHFSDADDAIVNDGVTINDLDLSTLDDLVDEFKANRMRDIDVPSQFSTVTIDGVSNVELVNYACKPSRLIMSGPNRGMYVPTAKPTDVTLNVMSNVVTPNGEATVYQPGSFWSARIKYRGLTELVDYVLIKFYHDTSETDIVVEEEEEEATTEERRGEMHEEEEEDIDAKEFDYAADEDVRKEEEGGEVVQVVESEQYGGMDIRLPSFYAASIGAYEPLLKEGKVRRKVDVVVRTNDDALDVPDFDAYDEEENDLLPLSDIVSSNEANAILENVGNSKFVYAKDDLVKVPNESIYELLNIINDKIESGQVITEDKRILYERVLDYATEKRKIK